MCRTTAPLIDNWVKFSFTNKSHTLCIIWVFMIMRMADLALAYCMQIRMYNFTREANVMAKWYCAFIGDFITSSTFFVYTGKSWVPFSLLGQQWILITSWTTFFSVRTMRCTQRRLWKTDQFNCSLNRRLKMQLFPLYY